MVDVAVALPPATLGVPIAISELPLATRPAAQEAPSGVVTLPLALDRPPPAAAMPTTPSAAAAMHAESSTLAAISSKAGQTAQVQSITPHSAPPAHAQLVSPVKGRSWAAITASSTAAAVAAPAAVDAGSGATAPISMLAGAASSSTAAAEAGDGVVQPPPAPPAAAPPATARKPLKLNPFATEFPVPSFCAMPQSAAAAHLGGLTPLPVAAREHAGVAQPAATGVLPQQLVRPSVIDPSAW